MKPHRPIPRTPGMAGAGRLVAGRSRRGRPRAPHPLRPPLAGAGAVAVLGDGHPPGPARLRLAGHGGGPRPLRRALLQGLQARPRRRGLAAEQLRLGRRGGHLRRPLDRHHRRPGPVAEGHRPRRAAGEAGRSVDPGPALRARRSESSGSAPATRAFSGWTSRAARSRASPTTRPGPRASSTTGSTSCTSTARTGCGWAPTPASTAGTPASFVHFRGRRRGPGEPERRPGARHPGGRRGRPLGRHLGRRPEPPGSRDRPLRALPPRPEASAPASRTTRCARSCRTRTAGCGWARAGASTCSTGAVARSRTTARTRRTRASLADDHVLSLAQDRGGVLWVGTRLGGVHKWNPLSWQFGHVAPEPGNPAGLGSGHVTSFSEDRAGRLWIGTFDAGLYVMDRTTGEMTAYRHDPKKQGSLGSDRVMALLARPPRRPLDRHAGRGPRPLPRRDRRLRALPQRPEASGGPQRQRRHLHPGGPRGPAVARHLRRAGWRRSIPRPGASRTTGSTRRTPTSLSGDKVSSLAEARGRPPVGGHHGEGGQPLRPADGPVRSPRAPAGGPRQPAHGRRPHALRGRGGRPLGGHARRPEPPAPGRRRPSRPSRRRTACRATSSTASAATTRDGSG